MRPAAAWAVKPGWAAGGASAGPTAGVLLHWGRAYRVAASSGTSASGSWVMRLRRSRRTISMDHIHTM